MRRLAATVLLTAAAAVSAAPAHAKWVVELEAAPTGLNQGDPWRAEIRVVGSHFPTATASPAVWIRNVETGSSLTYRSQPVQGRRRTFMAAVRFPEAGVWRYGVRYAGGRYASGSILIKAAPTAAPTANSGQPTKDGGIPLWLLLGLGLAAAFAGGGIAWLRRRRLPAWPTAPSSARTASRGR